MKPRYAALGLALVLLVACTKDGPAAGELAVDLITPNNDDGAIQFTVTAITPVTLTGVSSACTGCKLFVVKVSDTQYKGVLTGNLVTGILFRVGVSDTKKPSSYSLTITAVSNRTFATRNSLTGYVVTLK